MIYAQTFYISIERAGSRLIRARSSERPQTRSYLEGQSRPDELWRCGLPLNKVSVGLAQ
jgi:hypothetical protein